MLMSLSLFKEAKRKLIHEVYEININVGICKCGKRKEEKDAITAFLQSQKETIMERFSDMIRISGLYFSGENNN